MASIRAQTRLHYSTGLPQDVATNVTHWITPTPLTSDYLDEIGARLIAAYHLFDSFISTAVSRAADACEVVLYDLADPEPRIPVETYTFTLAAATGTDMPAEVAMVVSYHAAFVSGTPNARKRGRFYLGPISCAPGTGLGRPPTALINACVDMAELLWTPIDEPTVVWAQRSETTGVMSPVATGWVDNAWDTQRRRGNIPTARTSLGSPPA